MLFCAEAVVKEEMLAQPHTPKTQERRGRADRDARVPGPVSRRRCGQRGVYLPLVSVIAFALFFVLVALGIDTVRVKLAQSELRSKIDTICGELAHTPSQHGAALLKFRRFVNDLVATRRLRGARLEAASVSMPTMSANGFAFRSAERYDANDHSNYPPLLGSAKFGALLGTGNACVLDSKADCEFRGDVYNLSGYPPSLWNDLQNAGNTVGCEAIGSVNNLLLGERRFTVKSVFWRRVNGEWPDPVFDFKDPIATSPGLTIGVATELFTEIWDPRFRFGDSARYSYSRSFRSAVDPLGRWLYAAGFRSFSADLPEEAYPEVDSNGAPIDRFAGANSPSNSAALGGVARKTTTQSTDPWADLQVADFGTKDGPMPSDREALFVACMNPLILVRNTFLAAIVELASRNGQLRNMTEILHINPIHRAARFHVGAAAPIVNHPTRLVGFGEDLARPAYQLPFVFYHSGAPSDEYPTAGFSKNGWLNPFRDGWAAPDSGTELEWRRHHALIAAQLRSCYHMYSGSGQAGLERLSDPFTFLDNDGFEPELTAEGDEPRYRPRQRWADFPLRVSPYEPPATTGAAPPGWDQACPWADGCNAPPDSSETRRLSAGELMSVLGSTQMCPYRQSSAQLFPGPEPTIAAAYAVDSYPCPLTRRPGTYPSDELRGDINGFLQYTAGTGVALRSPGLFQLRDPTNLTRPFGTQPISAARPGPYLSSDNTRSAVLIVLHQPITDAEAAEIAPVIAAMQPAGAELNWRPITIAYFPATREEAGDISGMASAFNIDLTGDNGGVNQLFVFSPFDPRFGPPCNPDYPSRGTLSAEAESTLFHDYWACLLSNSNNSIAAYAANIFHERILRGEIKF